MRFSRLRLNGFKSFVDPTDLVIQEGLTGVVGPNGCGKSNLLEALRWVMGENRPTAMRGGGMEDVIFAGTNTRSARHFAEVGLIIDNQDRLAPAGFNDADQIEIIRRITRDAGSAYKANSKEVRARDIQMLFADASTGAHSPALVRQGQIAELINAKPRARRRILEEAAGISGLYQRRHEAELRLQATEQNLARVDDVLEQLGQQLATLARQARQAARYREIGAELRRAEGMLHYRRWYEADQAVSEAEALLRERLLAATQTETAARAQNHARVGAETALPPLREEEAIAGAILQRLMVQRDSLNEAESRALARINTLRARLEEMDRDLSREEGLNHDASETISRLEWEAEHLARATDGHDERLHEAAEAAREAAAVLGECEETLAAQTEDVARLAARHQSAQRLLNDFQNAVEKAEAAAQNARDAEGEASEALEHATAQEAEAVELRAEALERAESAEDALALAEEARADAQNREAEARALRSETEGEANALRAEVGALSRLLEREADSGTQVLDLIEVSPGFEAALGAALADDLRAPEAIDGQSSGWASLPDYDEAASLPAAARPLSQEVKGTTLLNRSLSQIGLIDPALMEGAKGAALQASLRPGQRLVSLEGDLWRWDGLRSRAEDAPSAAAQRLQQINRLNQLRQDLDALEARALSARQAHESRQARLTELSRADQAAREARRAADLHLTETARALSRAEAERAILGSKLESARFALARHATEASAARAEAAEAERHLVNLPNLEEARATIETLRNTVEAARISMMSRRSLHDEIRREGEARLKRSQEVTKELSGWRHRLETASRHRLELEERRAETMEELSEAQAEPEEIGHKREELAEAIRSAESRRSAASEALAQGEASLRHHAELERETERLASEAREMRARAETRLEASRDTRELITARILEDLDCSPVVLLSRLGCKIDDMPSIDALDLEVVRLRRARDALGAVNLRAEEDAKEIGQEHDSLAIEKTDLEEAIKKLRGGIQGLNREGRERLLTAFEQVNANFSTLFTHLFGGGEAKLMLVESDDPLEAGLEIMCQPPGKKLSTLSLLSGGEQTLTALSLIFAVFLANPAPICVLDEVDAPLDDANVTRFCDLLDEMTRRTNTRFLIITHHAVTMARMDRLFGVTMAEQGVSQLVSVDLRKAESLVA